MRQSFAILLCPFILLVAGGPVVAEQASGELLLKVATFDVDASPTVGSPLAYDPTKGVQDRLSCRGVVLVPRGKPIVLCAVDWIGISNESQIEFRRLLAQAVGTTPDRVAVHTLHQHDAPRSDLSTDRLLIEHGVTSGVFDSPFARQVMQNAAKAAKAALGQAQAVTHVGMGEGIVHKVASNRRILGDDGKVKYVRYTATRDAKIRAMPVGTIDPKLKMISFWNKKKAVLAMTYYATHPQSYYRTGLANPDFPGMARNAREKTTGVVHVHFNGAGGNIGAGKWNDGAKSNRQVLADRVAAGMKRAWDNTRKEPVTAAMVGWKTTPVVLPAGKHLDEGKLLAILKDNKQSNTARFAAAANLIWLNRCEANDSIDLACLSIGKTRVLHMPGELFVEYQLAAQKMRPDLFVAMAAYGDYAPGYIGTEIAYGQGGYETSPRASRVAPLVEKVLMQGIRHLLRD